MERNDVVRYMGIAAKARKKWAEAIAAFRTEESAVTKRLIHEGVQHYMSAEQIADAMGLTKSRVRAVMREVGLDPKKGKRMLADNAAKALQSNAELLGIKPWQMDLTSPLAYLPMGEMMKKKLIEEGVDRVSGNDNLKVELEERLNKPTICRVYRDGVLVFVGQDMSAQVKA